MSHDHDEKDAKGERECFEAHCGDVGIPISRGDDGGYEYADFRTNAAWDAWQAARADTARQVAEAVAREREACAAVCDKGAQHSNTLHQRQGAARCAMLIRDRSTQPVAGAPK